MADVELVTALRDRMNRTFGLNAWPKTLQVSAQERDAVENWLIAERDRRVAEWTAAGRPDAWHEDLSPLYVGPHMGVMFKGVELIVA